MAFFTSVLLVMFWVFMRADNLSTTLRAGDSALYGFVLSSSVIVPALVYANKSVAYYKRNV